MFGDFVFLDVNLYFMKLLIYSFFIFFSFSVLAQPKGAELKERNGVECYIHVVQPGNTLYGLHRLYNAEIDDILKYNPDLKINFEEGDEVYIPLSIIVTKTKKEEKQKLEEIKQVPKLHEVVSKETLYGISRKYNTTIDYLKAQNEVLKEGLKPGQKLIVGYESIENKSNQKKRDFIEVKQVSDGSIVENSLDSMLPKKKLLGLKDSLGFRPDVIVKHVVLEGETLYSISKRYMIPLKELYNYNNIKRTGISKGDILQVPVINNNGGRVETREISKLVELKIDSNYFHEKKTGYKIAVMLPFFLDKIHNDTLVNKDFIRMVSNLSTEFLMGLELALDSISLYDVSAEFTVYDTQNDSSQVALILDSLLHQEVDLVVGPFFTKRITEVASWCYDNKVKMICPVSTNTSVLKGNPYVDIAIASNFTLIEGLANYTIKNKGEAKVILIDPNNDSDKLLYDHFRESYLSNVSDDAEILVEASMEDYKIHIQKTGETILVFPSTDEGLSLNFVSDLMSYTDNRHNNVKIFSTKEWLNYESMKGSYMNKFNVHFAAPNNFSFKDSNIIEVAKIYRDKYGTDLTKISALGYDIATFLTHKYFFHNSSFYEGLMGDVKMYQKGEGNGFENNSVWIIHQKDYELLKVNDDK